MKGTHVLDGTHNVDSRLIAAATNGIVELVCKNKDEHKRDARMCAARLGNQSKHAGITVNHPQRMLHSHAQRFRVAAERHR